MDQEHLPLIDINSADEEELLLLSGVGPRLAQRIIEGRPYESVEDLVKVRGLSQRDLDRLKDFIIVDAEITADTTTASLDEDISTDETLETVPESDTTGDSTEIAPESEGEDLEEQETEAIAETDPTEVMDEEGESEESGELDEEEFESEDPSPDIEIEAEDLVDDPTKSDQALVDDSPEEDEPGITEEDSAAPAMADLTVDPEPVGEPLERSPYITRWQAVGVVVVACFFTTIITLAICLGFISALNYGSLQFASPAEITSLATELEAVSIQSDLLSDDLASVRERIDNLESLSGQVGELESELNTVQEELVVTQDGLGALTTQVNAYAAQVEEMTIQLEGLSTQIEAINSQAIRFELFLEGLNELMGNLFPEIKE
jgi:hypothetical protein